jgi:hypothetical protein
MLVTCAAFLTKAGSTIPAVTPALTNAVPAKKLLLSTMELMISMLPNLLVTHPTLLQACTGNHGHKIVLEIPLVPKEPKETERFTRWRSPLLPICEIS